MNFIFSSKHMYVRIFDILGVGHITHLMLTRENNTTIFK